MVTSYKMNNQSDNNTNNNNTTHVHNRPAKRKSQSSLDSTIRQRVNKRRKYDTQRGNSWTETMYDRAIQMEWESMRPRNNNDPTHTAHSAHNLINIPHTTTTVSRPNNNNDSKSEAIPMEDIHQTHPPAWTQPVQVYILYPRFACTIKPRCNKCAHIYTNMYTHALLTIDSLFMLMYAVHMYTYVSCRE